MWPIGRLVDYERNPRKNDAQVSKMVAAINEFGFRIPIVARSTDGLVIDGHLRLKAARKLKMTEVPVAIADDLSEQQIRAFRLLANRSATWAKWDDELLRLEFEDLELGKYDVRKTGFDAVEMADLLKDVTTEELTNGAGRSVPKAVLAYNLVFETAGQQKVWFDFIRYLRKNVAGENLTIGGRLSGFIQERGFV
jgi:hypothetical protein